MEKIRFINIKNSDEIIKTSVIYDNFVIPRIDVIKNAIYIPGMACLFDERGNQISESCSDFDARNKNFSTTKSNSPLSIEVPPDIELNNEVLIYGGAIGAHYGHFVTDYVSRLWVTKDIFPKNKILFIGQNPERQTKITYVKKFFNSINIENRIFFADRPMKFKEIIIPHPSIQETKSIFRVHDHLHEIVASKIIGENSSDRNEFDGPIWLSRRGLKKNLRSVMHEDKLEDILEGRGYKIVMPELLSFDEQILLFNTAKVIAGTVGSAFHTSLFSNNNNIKYFILTWDNLNGRYYLIDNIKNNNVTYVNSLVRQSNSDKTGPNVDVSINLEVALDAMHNECII